jgi:hypothetical protein
VLVTNYNSCVIAYTTTHDGPIYTLLCLHSIYYVVEGTRLIDSNADHLSFNFNKLPVFTCWWKIQTRMRTQDFSLLRMPTLGTSCPGSWDRWFKREIATKSNLHSVHGHGQSKIFQTRCALPGLWHRQRMNKPSCDLVQSVSERRWLLYISRRPVRKPVGLLLYYLPPSVLPSFSLSVSYISMCVAGRGGP